MRDAFKTIVGGRSADSLPAGNSRRGIEILLKKASVDEDFARVLLESPEDAARLISLELQESERRILANTPEWDTPDHDSQHDGQASPVERLQDNERGVDAGRDPGHR